MITHAVTFIWKPNMTQEQIDMVRKLLLALPGQIPSLRSCHVGPDLGAREGNSDFAVVATFDDLAGFREYADHPAHVAVVGEHVWPNLAQWSTVQFES